MTLAALSAITPLAIDMYLPAISNMSKSLDVPEPMVAISISIFFLGLALGQLFGGPISDAYGRKPIVMAGLGVFGVSSVFIIFTSDIHFLWALRFIQAFGGGVATVNVSATVRDMFNGAESARVFSMIGAISILAPLIAPALGLGVVSLFQSWEAIFVILAFYSFAALFFYQRFFKTQTTRVKTKITPVKNYMEILTSVQPMIIVTALVVSSSGFYALLASSSVVYAKYFGLSKVLFVVCFTMNILVLMATSKLNAKLVRRISPMRLLKFGIKAQVAITVVMMIFHGTTNAFLFAPLIALYIGTLGFVFGNAISMILEHFPKTSASANAVIGVLQYTVGALVGILASAFDDGTLFPLMLVIMISSALGAIILFAGVKRAKILA